MFARRRLTGQHATVLIFFMQLAPKPLVGLSLSSHRQGDTKRWSQLSAQPKEQSRASVCCFKNRENSFVEVFSRNPQKKILTISPPDDELLRGAWSLRKLWRKFGKAVVHTSRSTISIRTWHRKLQVYWYPIVQCPAGLLSRQYSLSSCPSHSPRTRPLLEKKGWLRL